MKLELDVLRVALNKRNEIEKSIAGTGYLLKTIMGVGTFLLDNEGDIDLLTVNQRATFEKFLKPLLDESSP